VSGIIITVLKGYLDVVAQKGWRWGDFFWGIAGFLIGIIFLTQIDFFANPV